MVKVSRRKTHNGVDIMSEWLENHGDPIITKKVTYQLMLASKLHHYVVMANLSIDDISFDLKLNIDEVHALLSGRLTLDLELLMRIKDKYNIYNEY